MPSSLVVVAAEQVLIMAQAVVADIPQLFTALIRFRVKRWPLRLAQEELAGPPSATRAAHR
jgi:hypothetical protein